MFAHDTPLLGVQLRTLALAEVLPQSLAFRAYGGIVRLLKVATAAPERGDDGCGHRWLEQWLCQPTTFADMNEVYSSGGLIGVVEVRARDAAEPIEAVGITGPDQ